MNRATDKPWGVQQLHQSLADDDVDRAVPVILKVRGETCDIDCLYCYEKRQEALGGARVGVQHLCRLGMLFRGRPLAIELYGGEALTAGPEHLAEIRTTTVITQSRAAS
jgi:uncharacterized protein